jgi:hypothetical protein
MEFVEAPRASGSGAASFGGQLARLQSAIESKFLAAGDVLCKAVEGLGLLIGAVDGLAATLSPQAIETTSGELRLAACKLSALPARLAHRGRSLAETITHRAALAESAADMRRSLDYMRAFSFNIKIAAGGIVTDDSDFGLFALEIADCISRGCDQLAKLEAQSHALDLELNQAVAFGGNLEQSCQTLIPAIPNELNASAAVMADHQRRITEAAARAGRLAEESRSRIGRILTALQIGDSTAQRIAHVCRGLALLQQATSAAPHQLGPAAATLVNRLLVEQLSGAASEFNREVATINTSMAGLVEDLGVLLNLRDLAYGRSKGEQDGILRQLERRIGQALGLVMEIDAADTAAGETGDTAARAAQDLSDRLAEIQRIKASVRYVAINTTLKSARIGEAGRPMSVIAVELGVHAGHLEVAAELCLKALQALTRAAAALIPPAGDGPQERDTPGVTQALGAAAARLREAGDRTERDIARLAGQGETLIEMMGQCSNRLNLRAGIGGALQQAAQELACMAPESGPCDPDDREPLNAVLNAISASYTMAQERRIHEMFAAERGLDAADFTPLAALAG